MKFLDILVDLKSLTLKTIPTLLGLAISILIERTSTTENVGIYSQIQMLFNLLTLFALFGNDQELFKNRAKDQTIEEILSSKSQFFLISCLFGFLLFSKSYSLSVGIISCFSLYFIFTNRVSSFYFLVKKGYNYATKKYDILPFLIIFLGIAIYNFLKFIDFTFYIVLLLGFSRIFGLNKIRFKVDLTKFKSSGKNALLSALNFFSLNFELLIVSFVISPTEFAVLSLNFKLLFAFTAVLGSLPLRRLSEIEFLNTKFKLSQLTIIPILFQIIFLAILFISYKSIISIWGEYYTLNWNFLLLLSSMSIIYLFNSGLSLKMLEIELAEYDIFSRIFRILFFLTLLGFNKLKTLNDILIFMSVAFAFEAISKLIFYGWHYYRKLFFRNTHKDFY